MAGTPFDAILDNSRALMVERAAEAVSSMLERAEATLNDLIDKTEDQEARSLLGAGRDSAGRGREALQAEFAERYAKGFGKRVRKVKRGITNRQNPGDQTGAFEIELELVGDDDLEETLSYNKLAARIRKHCDEALGALDQRAAVMLGDGNLQSEDNPFGPKVFCDAFKAACREVETDPRVRKAFLQLFDEQVLDDLGAGYDDVNELLVENSILPKIRYTVVKKDRGGKKRGAEEADDAAEESAPAEQALPDDVFGAIQKMMGGEAAQGGPGGGMGVGGVPMVQGAELLTSLSRIQGGNVEGVTGLDLAALNAAAGSLTNVLTQLKESSIGQSMGQVDAMTLNVVSMLFDKLFDDGKVPAGIKALAARLQIPMLKVAIADKALFSDKSHAARVHLDLLGDLGARLPADFDDKHPLYEKLAPVELEIVEKFEDNVEVFAAANGKLQAFIAEADQGAAQAAQAESKRLEQLENLSAGRSAAQEEIRGRLRERHPGKAVRDFLAQQWIKVLLVVHAQAGRDSEPWKAALATMDQLLWSVEPKPKQEEQRKLAQTVPSLLRALTTGLNSVGVEDSVRQAFYADLMKLHTAVMALDSKPRGGGDTHAAKPATPAPTTTATKAPMPAAATAAPASSKAEDDELDFTREITVKNPFGAGEAVKVEELDFTDAAPAPAPTAPKADGKPEPRGAKPAPEKEKKPAKEFALPSKLKEGAWVGIREETQDPEEPRQPAKLLYMSPLKTRFLFCDRGGRKVLECNRTELTKRLKLREIVIIPGDPDASLFERILRGVMNSIGAEA